MSRPIEANPPEKDDAAKAKLDTGHKLLGNVQGRESELADAPDDSPLQLAQVLSPEDFNARWETSVRSEIPQWGETYITTNAGTRMLEPENQKTLNDLIRAITLHDGFKFHSGPEGVSAEYTVQPGDNLGRITRNTLDLKNPYAKVKGADMNYGDVWPRSFEIFQANLDSLVNRSTKDHVWDSVNNVLEQVSPNSQLFGHLRRGFNRSSPEGHQTGFITGLHNAFNTDRSVMTKEDRRTVDTLASVISSHIQPGWKLNIPASMLDRTEATARRSVKDVLPGEVKDNKYDHVTVAGTTPRFVREYMSQWENMPANLKGFLQKNGVKTLLVGDMRDDDPDMVKRSPVGYSEGSTWLNSEAAYNIVNKMVILAEHSLVRDSAKTNTGTIQADGLEAFDHYQEVGHAIDFLLGPAKDNVQLGFNGAWSVGSEFTTAYTKDLDAQAGGTEKPDPYFVQKFDKNTNPNDKGGRIELFSVLATHIYEDPAKQTPLGVKTRNLFPNAYREVYNLLHKHNLLPDHADKVKP